MGKKKTRRYFLELRRVSRLRLLRDRAIDASALERLSPQTTRQNLLEHYG